MKERYIPEDLPREELIKAAEEACKRYPGVELHFKFTCAACGRRCMLAKPYKLSESGECDGCGNITPITQGGFDLFFGPNFYDNRPSAKS